jgi:HK97 family phage portal protein
MIREALARLLGAFRRKPGSGVETASITDAFRQGNSLQSPLLLGSYDGPEAALQVSALSACVRLISGNVAKLPFHVFRMVGDERERDRKHPLDRLLNQRPNGWQTAHEFRRMLTAHVALYGNAYAVKVMSGATIDELIPIHPSKVKVVKEDPFLPPMYDVQVSAGVTRRYLASDMLHLRDLSLDGIVGMSRIQQARQGVTLAVAAESYATSYFLNGAEPGIVLETEKQLTPDQRNDVRRGYIESHQGPGRAHLPVVAEGGMKVKPIGTSNKDSQFLELRSFQVEDIARLYGVPPHLIGLTEKQTSWGTGIEQMAIGFLQFNLLDWLVMWETAIRRDCLSAPSDRDVFVEHLVDGLLRGDLKTRMDSYALGIQNGILNRNEARKKENLPPYEGGEKFLYPANMAVNGAASPGVVAPAVFPSDSPKRAWMTRILAARRAVASREVA